MKNGLYLLWITALFLCAASLLTAQQICTNKTGSIGNGYQYELWTMGIGSSCMTVKGADAQFETEWSNVGDFFALVGRQFDQTQTPAQIGTFSATYACTFNGGANGLMGIHGLMTSPYIEFYIVDNWGNWNPTGVGSFVGSYIIDGSRYQFYKQWSSASICISALVDKIEIYWSVRESKRKSGTISVSEHFAQWEKLGMAMSKLYNVMLFVEGYQSTGSADFTEANITITNTTLPTSTPTPIVTTTPTLVTQLGDVNGNGIININDALLAAKYSAGITITGTFIPENADVNKDDMINIVDALKIALYSAGLIPGF